MINNKLIISIALILITVFFVNDTKKTVLNIPLKEKDAILLVLTGKEKRQLELFFRVLFRKGTLAYTLNGPKPLALDSFYPFKSNLWIFNDFSNTNLALYKGYIVWQKYASFFSDSDFIIWTEPSSLAKDVDFIFAANVKKLTATLKNHQTLFKAYANVEDIDDAIVHHHIKNKTFFSHLLNHNELLLGISLGYGEENANLYCQNRDHPENNSTLFWDISCYQEQTQFLALSKQALLSQTITYPFFVGNPNTETGARLKKELLLARENNLKLFEQNDFLETVLSLMAQKKHNPSNF